MFGLHGLQYCLNLFLTAIRFQLFNSRLNLFMAIRGQCLESSFLIEVGDFQTQMAAAGVDNDIDVPIIVLVRLNKMIASAQSANAMIGTVSIDLLCAAQLRQINFFCVTMQGGTDCKARRNALADNLIQLLRFDVGLFQADGFHAASNINANKVGANLILDRHGGSDGAASTGMNVRHHTNLTALDIGLVQEIDDLRNGFTIDHIGKHFCRSVFPLKLKHFIALLWLGM